MNRITHPPSRGPEPHPIHQDDRDLTRTGSCVYTKHANKSVYMLRPIEGMTIPGNCCTIPGNTGSAKSWEFSRYYSQDFSDIVLFTYFAADSRYFVKVMVFKYVGTGNL